MPYSSSKVVEITRASDGRLSIKLLHTGSGLPDISQQVDVGIGASPGADWLRAQAMQRIAALNAITTYQDSITALVNINLDITTPIPVETPTGDTLAIKEFTDLWKRNKSLEVSVAGGFAKQVELDDALVAVKAAYSKADDTLKPSLDLIMQRIT